MLRWFVLSIAILIGGMTSAGAQSIALEQRSILDGKVSMLLPEEFELMGEEMMRLKYPSERRPTLVFTNPDASVNIAINHTKNPIQPGDIPAVLESLKSMYSNLYPSAQWYQSELIEINGREFLVLDLTTPAIDTEIRNMIIGTSYEGRLLLFTFNTIRALEEIWVPVGIDILNSIEIGG